MNENLEGFNDYGVNPIAPGTDELTSVEANDMIPSLLGSNISGGIIQSVDGHLQINLQTDQITVSNGTENNVVIGLITPPSTFGIQITDGTITGSTIVGGTIETGTTGQRIVVSSDGTIKFYWTDSSYIGDIVATTYTPGVFAVSIVDSSGFNSINVFNTGLAMNALGGFVGIDNSSGITTIYGSTNVNVTSDMLPTVDNSYNLGNNSFRWKLVRGVTITPGDLAWEETKCYICNKDFEQGDKLTMIVKKMSDEYGDLLTYTVPICKSCFLED